MRNIAFFALSGAIFIAAPALAQQEPEYIPPPAPPSVGAAEDAAPVREILARRTFVQPSDYEVLGPRQADYPIEAWNKGQEGDVGYTVYVGTDGKPEYCRVTESSGFQLLDEAACRLIMERGVFEPATDADGMTIVGEFSSRYRWRKHEPEFGGTMTVHVAFTVNEDGTTTDCEPIEISGNISERRRRQIDREPCPGVNRAGGIPYRDENGVPVAKRINLLLQVEVADVDK